MAGKSIEAIQRSVPPVRKEELRASLLELAECCLLGQANPEDCPLFLLRKMDPVKRSQWFNLLSEDDLIYLAAYHQVCLNIRLQTALAGLCP